MGPGCTNKSGFGGNRGWIRGLQAPRPAANDASPAAPGCFRTSTAGKIRLPVSAGSESCCQRRQPARSGSPSGEHRRRNAVAGLCRLPIVLPMMLARPLGRLVALAAHPPHTAPPRHAPAAATVQVTERTGAVRCRRKQRGNARRRSLQSGGRRPETSVPRRETRRHGPGTRPSGDRPF